MDVHSSHPKVIQRLRRAEGHLCAVIGMIEEARPCLEIVQQLQAVENAIAAAKRVVAYDHIDECLERAAASGPLAAAEAIREFKEVTKYL